jgi:hypothetical protein
MMPFSSSKDRRRSRWVVRPLRWAPDHQSVDENFSIFPECRLLLFSAWKIWINFWPKIGWDTFRAILPLSRLVTLLVS